MKKAGLLPFTTVGFLILLLAVAAITQYQWSIHQYQRDFIEDSATNKIVTDITSRLNELEREARNSLYDALWRVGKNAYKFEDETDRQNTIENWASSSFHKSLSSLAQADENILHQPKFNFNPGDTLFQLKPYSGGYPRTSIKLPENTRICGSLPDNSLSLDLQVKKLKTTADVRYYLLQDKMRSFITNKKAIEDKWKYSEYGIAYTQAWMEGRVDLNESRSRALFQVSWASHELSNFGSSDYFETALNLTGLSQKDLVLPEYETNIVIKPLKKEKIEKISGRIDESISYLEESRRKLKVASNKAGKLENFELEDHFKEILNRFTELKNQIDNLSSEEANRRFQNICKDSKSIYSYPTEKILEVLKEIRCAKELVEESEDQFQSALELTRELGKDNPLLEQLNKSFTGDGKTSERIQRIFTTFEDISIKLGRSAEEAFSLRKKLRAPEELHSLFPAEFPKRFSETLEENTDQASKIISNARNTAAEAFGKFKQAIEEDKEKTDRFCRRLSRKVEEQTKTPRPNKIEKFEKYPEPGESPQEPPVVKKVEKYVLRKGGDTIGGIRKVLEEIKMSLEHLTDLSKKFESEQGELHEFVVENDLKKVLTREVEYRLPLELDREQFYEISPPKPLRSEPGISVYHKVEVKNICYTRMDPVGWLHPEAPPTPIHIWPINVTLYWAMWDVHIKLEEPVIEEIFDYKNLVIPRPLSKGSNQNFEYIHKPLAYRWKLNKKEFSFPLVIISLREFSIS